MGSIKVLQDNIINQIAAGEVVERPASVVKELVENAIDSGASRITIETAEGGISLIRISDNGKGIPENEVFSAFMRHATSKIENMDDLAGVLTLGFRGEALSSISSVSQIEITTKPEGQLMGKRLEIEAGKLINEQEVGFVTGTTIVVKNIFFNTPARRKFLKKPGTESGYISDLVNKIALGHPNISFRYLVNGSEILYTSGSGDLKTVIFNVYGKDIAKKTIEINYAKDDFEISGYICKPEVGRGNRSYSNLFINNRFIKSDIIQSAIEEAYKTKLMVGKFPVYVLNLKINPKLVDVNVHPTKMEVRFSDERKIFGLFYDAVFQALKDEQLIPVHETKEIKNPFLENKYKLEESQGDIREISTLPISLKEEKSDDGYERNSQAEKKPVDISQIVKSIYREENEKGLAYISEAKPVYYSSNHEEPPKSSTLNGDLYKSKLQANATDTVSFNRQQENNENAVNTEERANKLPFFSAYKIIGQVFNTYWIVEQKGSLYLIDQHAAHEKVIFEKLLGEFKSKKTITQGLVMPLSVNLSEKEKEVLKDNLQLLEDFGFEVEYFPDDTYALKGIPSVLKEKEYNKAFMDILDSLNSLPQKLDNIYDTKIDSIATMSCKAAVKGNDKLSVLEAKALIDQLLALENPFTCPHGRPTIIELTKYEIEKMFKRIQ